MNARVILYNRDENVVGGDELDRIAARDNLDGTVDEVEKALSTLGPVARVETVDGDPETLAREIRRHDPRVVFNLAEAARGVPALEPCVAGVLELLGVSYTGNTPSTLALCLDKPRAKALLAGVGLRVPQGILVRDAARDSFAGLEYPVIVKPAFMDASHGIEPRNVVHDEASARALAGELIARFPPAAIVEQFIDGRELNVTVVQLEAHGRPEIFPIAEIDWTLPEGVARVCGYEAKWVEGSESFAKTLIISPTTLDPHLDRRVRETCLAAFAAVGGRDYLRVDCRVDAADQVYVLEVNPNPCISPVAGVATAADLAGWSYHDFIRRIALNAEERGPLAPLRRPR